MNMPYWLRGLRRDFFIFVIGGLGGSSLAGLILWLSLSFAQTKINFASLTIPFTGALVSVILLISTVVVHLAELSLRTPQKRGVTPLLYSLILLLIAVFLSVATYFINSAFYWSVSFLVIGALFFFNEFRVVILDETFGATLRERITYESRVKKEPVLGEPSLIGKDVFQDKIHIHKGDAILALCDSIWEGRRLAREIIRTSNYSIYITAERPWTIIKEEFKDHKGNLYCIDCFTNFYGLEEFKEAEYLEKGENFYPYTIRPVTIRKLHSELRDIRKRLVSKIFFNKDWSQLNNREKKKVREELASKEAEKERKENVRIIYDSVSSLASIFNMEDLFQFLIHDTNVDKTIGRNTLLLVKKGVLEDSVIKRLESFCDVCLNPTIMNGKMHFHINDVRGEKPPADFSMDSQ